MTLAPIDLHAHALHFHPDGAVHAAASCDSAEPDGWHLAAFRAQTDADVHADHWEMHPTADEAVCCLTGAIRLVLRPEQQDAPQEAVRLTPGSGFVVPRGHWHRIELDEPSDLMAVTLRHGTRLEPRAV